MLLQEHSSCLCLGENGKPFCLAELWPALIVRIHWDFTINAVHAFQEKKNFGFTNASSTCSFPLHGRPNILLVNYDSWWQHQMSVRELRHDRPSGWFSKSRGLSASVSFLSSPPPPRSFTCAIFRAVFDSCSSFFAPKPHRNACYAGYIPREFQRLITGKLTGLDPGRPQNLQRRKVEVTSRKPK